MHKQFKKMFADSTGINCLLFCWLHFTKSQPHTKTTNPTTLATHFYRFLLSLLYVCPPTLCSVCLWWNSMWLDVH